MGWRVSWYQANKENPITVKYDEVEGYDMVTINGKLIMCE